MRLTFDRSGVAEAPAPETSGATAAPVPETPDVAALSSVDAAGNTVTEVVGASQPVPPPPPVPAPPPAVPAVRNPDPTSLLPAPAHGNSLVVDDDRILLTELVIPTLNLVQGVGDLAASFEAGSWVFDKTHTIATPPPKDPKRPGATVPAPVEMVVIGFRPTRYSEKMPGGSGGRILNTVADVARVGGTTVYDEAYEGKGKERKQKRPYFTPLATALILLKAPADVSGLSSDVEAVFPMDVVDGEGKVTRFAIGFWHLGNTAFTHVARPLKTARTLGVLRGDSGYKGRWIKASCTFKEWDDGKSGYSPVVKIGDKTSDAIRQAAQLALDSLLRAE